jgi:hypothetical protein
VIFLSVTLLLSFVAAVGGERRAAFPLRDSAAPLGTLLVSAGLLHVTERRMRA